MRKTLLVIVVIGVLLLLVGCTNQVQVTGVVITKPKISIESAQLLAQNAERYIVVIDDHKLLPDFQQIHAGDTVEFVNKDNGRYELLFDYGESEELPRGAIVEHTFASSGEYRYTALFLDHVQNDEDKTLLGMIVAG